MACCDTGIIPIQKKFLQQNEPFALEFREGFLFGRVVRRRIVQWKPWPLIDSNGANIFIPPSTFQAELRFRDPRNTQNDILYLDTSTNAGWPWFLHGAFGIKTQYVNTYLRYPEGDIIPGKFPAVDPIRSQLGDDITPLNDLSSPYEEPTDYIETIIQPGIHIAAEYYNKDTVKHVQPTLNLLFALYWVQWLKPTQHPTQIADIALKRYEGSRAIFLKAGFGDYPHNLGVKTIDDWGVKPMSIDEASVLGGR